MRGAAARAVPNLKMRMRRKAVRALASHTGNAVRDLRNDEDEMLRGALAAPHGQRDRACADTSCTTVGQAMTFHDLAACTLDAPCSACCAACPSLQVRHAWLKCSWRSRACHLRHACIPVTMC